MPRRKRASIISKSNVNKRWCPESLENNNNTSLSSDDVTGNASKSLRLSNLECLPSNTNVNNENSPKYILIDVNNLQELFENILCNECKCNSLSVEFGVQHGFSHTLKLICKNCELLKKEVETSTVVKKSDMSQKCFDINLRVVQAFLGFGRGFSALEMFCMCMNMKTMSSRTFNLYKNMLHSACTAFSEKQLQNVRREVRNAYGNFHDDDIVNISVSYDGTWLTRGHTSQIGVGSVIDLLTGYVVDFEVLSKRCTQCEQSKASLGENSPEFDVWFHGHKKVCSINHSGSSGAMEVEAALKIWKRSEEKGFRYTTLLSDGDSKSFLKLTEANVYGKNIKIQKEECVNHVSKRLGTALRNAVKEWRSRGVTLGGKSYGSLKEVTIKKLTRYYQNAIRKNKGNVADMKTAIYATLYHNISTDRKPQHNKCPAGKDSWCFYQSALADNKIPESHATKIKTPINEAHLVKILPIYQRLASNELLERCVRCATQNSNESLHSMIWSKCSKESSASLQRVKIAVCNAITEFNVGTLKMLQGLQEENNIQLSAESKRLAVYKDYRRSYGRNRKNAAIYRLVQKKIKIARLRKLKEEIKKEGICYKAGGF